jgi:hypothetical protein
MNMIGKIASGEAGRDLYWEPVATVSTAVSGPTMILSAGVGTLVTKAFVKSLARLPGRRHGLSDEAVPGRSGTVPDVDRPSVPAAVPPAARPHAPGPVAPPAVVPNQPSAPSVAAPHPRSVAGNAADGVRLRARLAAEELAGADGHAFRKHVVERGEFPGIRTRSEFSRMIEEVIVNGEMRELNNGRTAFWRNGVVVIRNPRSNDGGTVFAPTSGYSYFLNLT